MTGPSRTTEKVPLRYIKTLLRVATEQGYDATTVFKRLDLPAELLSASADPSELVPAAYYNRIYNFVLSMLQDESLGVSMRHPSVSGSFRMMCLYVIHCHDLGSALRRAAEFQSFCRSLLNQPIEDYEPLQLLDNNLCLFQFPDSDDFAAQGTDLGWYTIAHTLAVWRRFCSWLIGNQIQLETVRIQSPAPADLGTVQRIFDCPIEFGQSYNGIVFEEHYLSAPVTHTEESLKRFLRNAPYHLLANTEIESDEGIVSQMRRIVGHDLSREFPSVIDMSNALNMSVRTLRRRLLEVDTTYQEFKDQTRRDAALQLLTRPELKINAVAALLGFDEPSAFHRSFKKWTGSTPGEYRKGLHG